ncbi:hypothetical protein Tco_0269094 [Tanacetum coccineum]
MSLQGIAKVSCGGIRLVDKGEKKGEQCLGEFWRVVRTGQPKEMYTVPATFEVLKGLTVVLDDIALTSCYLAFLITTDVPEIFLRVLGKDFDALPSEEDIVSFLRELNHTGEINSLNDVFVDYMHQPWRTFAAIINRGLSGKTSGLDKLRLSRAQIL